MSISTKIENFMSNSSWIRKMFEDGIKLKEQYGKDNVFDFSLGNPSVAPPLEFKEALSEILKDESLSMHGYMPNAGYLETRKQIASKLSLDHSPLSISPNNLIMTCGAGGALNVVFKALLDKDDEVIIPAPFFVEYRFYVDNFNGVIKIVKTNEDFSLNIEEIEKKITAKTKIILINSPNNPTGKIYDEESIKKLSSLLCEKEKEFNKQIYLVSDEPYNTIVYDDVKVPSIFKAYNNSIIVNSYSKTISIPGERIGYVATNPNIFNPSKLVEALAFTNRILGFVNAPAIMQRVVGKICGAIVDVGEYKRKRDIFCDGLSKIGYDFNVPEGAFYLFPKSPIEDDVEFVKILQKEKILTVPGSGFGGPGHFRIAYCVDDETILNSMDGFKKAFDFCK